jgi:acetyl-CoA acyltransferase 1
MKSSNSLRLPRHIPNNDLQIVVTACLRTAFTKGGKGGFKDTAAADMLVGAFKALIERSNIDPGLVEDIAVGSVLPPGGGATEFRAAALAAGFPVSAAVKSLNRQCSSGLQACVDIANAISAGMIEVGVGAGVESMSLQYGYVYTSLSALRRYADFSLDQVPSQNSPSS